LLAEDGQTPDEPWEKGDPMVTGRVCEVLCRRVVAVIVGAVLLTGCGGGGTTEESATSPGQAEETTTTTPASAEPTSATSPAPAVTGTRVTAELTEFSIGLSQQTFAPGPYEFVAEEQGQLPHALSIEGPGVDSASTSVIDPGGDSQTLNLTLQPGTYELWCPVGNHRAQGMETTITVE
jgi:uncharacterized cupredoxin-like copper-binding protein